MKYIINILILLLVVVGFNSCDEEDLAKILPDIKVNISATEEIPVFVNQTNGSWANFTNTVPISIINDDTDNYLNKIKAVKINKLSYKIINFAGDANGKVDVSFSVENVVSLTNAFTVKTSADNATVYQITETAELNRIANELLNKKTITVKYSGDALCDDGDMDFIVEVRLDATITINP